MTASFNTEFSNLLLQCQDLDRKTLHSEEIDDDELNALNEKINDISRKIPTQPLDPKEKKIISKKIKDARVCIKTIQAKRAVFFDQAYVKKLEAQENFSRIAKNILGPLYNEVEEHIQTQFNQYASTGVLLEDYSDAFFGFLNQFLENHGLSIENIQDLITTCEEPKRTNMLKFITDLFLFTCVHSSKKQPHPSYLSLFSFEERKEILRKFILKDSVEVFDSLKFEQYNEMNVPQKILTLFSLKMARDPGTSSAVHSRIYISLIQSDRLMSILHETNVMCEQYWLNTCTSASFNQELLIKITSIPLLFSIEKDSIDKIHEQLYLLPKEEYNAIIFQNALGRGGVKKGEYILSTINELISKLRVLEQKLIVKINNNTLEAKDISKAMKTWNKHMQIISGLLDITTQPAYLSKKIVKGHWALSGALLLVPGVVGSLFKSPKPVDRIEEPNYDGFIRLMRISLSRSFHSMLPSLTEAYEVARSSDELTMAQIDQTWEDIFNHGGSLFETEGHFSVSHSLYIRAVQIDGKKFFALTEPKVSSYKLYPYEDLEKLLKSK
jgi:hypothetical protein